jgi:hypothetical protein
MWADVPAGIRIGTSIKCLAGTREGFEVSDRTDGVGLDDVSDPTSCIGDAICGMTCALRLEIMLLEYAQWAAGSL